MLSLPNCCSEIDFKGLTRHLQSEEHRSFYRIEIQSLFLNAFCPNFSICGYQYVLGPIFLSTLR